MSPFRSVLDLHLNHYENVITVRKKKGKKEKGKKLRRLITKIRVVRGKQQPWQHRNFFKMMYEGKKKVKRYRYRRWNT